MLNDMGLLGFLLGLVLFVLLIRACMEGTNYIGNKFRQLIKYLINLLSNKRRNN